MIPTLCVLAVIGLILAYHTVIITLIMGVYIWWIWPFFAWVMAHPWKIASYVAGYLLIGAAWSVVKWYLVEVERVREAKLDYPLDWQSRKTNLSSRYQRGDYATWIVWWPFSLFWAIFDDLIIEIVNKVVAELRGVYQRVTNYVWRD